MISFLGTRCRVRGIDTKIAEDKVCETSCQEGFGMSTDRLLESDLRALSAEAKGFAAVKDAAERGILRVREAQEAFAAGEKVRAPEFIRPFLLACNHVDAGKRLVSVAIAAIQRLIMMDVVDRSEPPNIMRVLMLQVYRLSCAIVRLSVFRAQKYPRLLLWRSCSSIVFIIYTYAFVIVLQLCRMCFFRAERQPRRGSAHQDSANAAAAREACVLQRNTIVCFTSF